MLKNSYLLLIMQWHQKITNFPGKKISLSLSVKHCVYARREIQYLDFLKSIICLREDSKFFDKRAHY